MAASLYIIYPKDRSWVRGEYAEDRLGYLQQLEHDLTMDIADNDKMISDLRQDAIQKTIQRRHVRNEIADLKWRMR